MLSKNNKILVGCLALLLVLSVGYALFSDTITINGSATAKGDFDITATCETGIASDLGTADSLGLSSEGGYENDSCTVVDDAIEMSVGLLYPTATRYFTIKMTNSGSIDAILDLQSLAENVQGEFCSADNQEGENLSCRDWEPSGSTDSGTFAVYDDSVYFPVAFLTADGVLVNDESSMLDFIDTTNLTITLKSGETAIWLVKANFYENYGTSGYGGYSEFFISYDMSLEYPWQQATN